MLLKARSPRSKGGAKGTSRNVDLKQVEPDISWRREGPLRRTRNGKETSLRPVRSISSNWETLMRSGNKRREERCFKKGGDGTYYPPGGLTNIFQAINTETAKIVKRESGLKGNGKPSYRYRGRHNFVAWG